MQRQTTCKSTTSLCFSGACVLSQHWGRWSSLGLSPPGKIYQFWLPVFKPFLRYWSFDKSDIPALPILRSLGRTFRWLSASVWASKNFQSYRMSVNLHVLQIPYGNPCVWLLDHCNHQDDPIDAAIHPRQAWGEGGWQSSGQGMDLKFAIRLYTLLNWHLSGDTLLV